MALESATYISQLVSTNPPASDSLAQASDHLRLIKYALQTTLPNANAAITSTVKNLNDDLVPVGGVIVWYSTIGSIPTGWGLCDGSTYTLQAGSGSITSPNLTSVFPTVSGTAYPYIMKL